MGMVGGGQGAFIGWVHRMAAALDQQIETVAGCFSREPENTRTTGEQLYLDPARCYETYEQMAAAEANLPEDERMDFVSIVTQTVSHFDIARRFLESGFHVVCDKPMTHSLEEAEQLVRLVEDSGLVFALTHNYTGTPLVRQAREMFRSGLMGQVRKVICSYLQDCLMRPLEKEGNKQIAWRVDPAQAGIGGTLGDAGVHCLNLIEYVTGEKVAAVAADKSTFLPDRTLDEDVNMLIRMDGGGKGIIAVSQIATGEENNLTLRVYASEGGIIWRQENPNYLEVYRYGQPRQVFTRAHGEYLSDAATDATRVPTGHPEGYLEAFANIYVGVVRAIRAYLDGEPLETEQYEFPTVYDGLRGLTYIHAAVESAENDSAWVPVG
jgi:predicted dehydrogenase